MKKLKGVAKGYITRIIVYILKLISKGLTGLQLNWNIKGIVRNSIQTTLPREREHYLDLEVLYIHASND